MSPATAVTGWRLAGTQHVGPGLPWLTADAWRDGHTSYPSYRVAPCLSVLAADFGMVLVYLLWGCGSLYLSCVGTPPHLCVTRPPLGGIHS